MTTKELNKFNMFKNVLNILEQNNAVFNGTKAFDEAFKELKTAYELAVEKSEGHLHLMLGKTSAKTQGLDELIKVILPVSSAFYAFASKEKNMPLKEMASLTESKLKKMRTIEITQWVNIAYKAFDEHINKLGDYGLSKANIDDLKKKIAEFEKLVDDKESDSTTRTSLRQDLTEAIKKIDNILSEQIDSFAEMQKFKNPEFYNLYQNARTVHNSAATRESKKKDDNNDEDK